MGQIGRLEDVTPPNFCPPDSNLVCGSIQTSLERKAGFWSSCTTVLRNNSLIGVRCNTLNVICGNLVRPECMQSRIRDNSCNPQAPRPNISNIGQAPGLDKSVFIDIHVRAQSLIPALSR